MILVADARMSVPSEGIRRRCTPRAQERQRRLGEDGEREADGGDDQRGPGDVGQDVLQHCWRKPASGR